MPNNSLKDSLRLLVWVILTLLLFSLVKQFTVAGMKFKRVDLLADVREDPPKVVAAKKDTSTKATPKEAKKPKTPCPKGVTCLEDYSESKNALATFYAALNESSRRPVRAAFFGDSFIEGDILCASFRDTLQHLFGGQGVGYVPITSEVAQFRTTIQHTFSGWKTYWAVGEKNPDAPLGVSGYCFVPGESNEVEYRPGKKRGGSFHSMRIFYEAFSPSWVHYTLDDSLAYDLALDSTGTLEQARISCDGKKAVKLNFEPPDSLRLYGVSFESRTGVFVDNFAMRGNSGMGLLQTSPEDQREFNKFQNYKLILLQYGLNVVGENDSTGYDWYANKMVRVVEGLKENFPGSSIILLGISDRSYNQNGKFVTMPNILLMRNAQREVARRTHIAFWDVFAAMGGENSMVKFVSATPALAAKDYTHLTFWGGRKLAKKLAEAILHERSKHARKN